MSYIPKKERIAKMNPPSNAEQLKYIETDFYEYVTNSFLYDRVSNGIDVYGYNVRVQRVPDISKDMHNFCNANFKDVRIFAVGDRTHFIRSSDVIVSVHLSSNSVKIDAQGDLSATTMIEEFVKKTYNVVAMTIDWVTDGDMNTVEIPLIAPQGVTDSAYPFIEEGVENFIDDYLKGTENVIILLGKPGTGKSNLVKHIIARSGRNALVTYDPEIMKKDSIFALFAEGNYGTMVLEDADAFLGQRTEGNDMMHKFLNSSDGIVSNSGKKLIFTTNLESVDEIDPALLRPGRCFAVVSFRRLTKSESVSFVKEHGLNWLPTEIDYSLAELYNHTKRDRNQQRRKVGFY